MRKNDNLMICLFKLNYANVNLYTKVNIKIYRMDYF